MAGDHQLRLLALDGGGVGGTSTGGLIAIMLGRLRMTVDECINAYTTLSDRVFEKKHHRFNIKGNLQGRFDAAELERAVKRILVERGLDEETLLLEDSPEAPCKVFVCATSKETKDTVCLTSYLSPRGRRHLLESTTIWQACRATSAATSFFDPIAIGPFGEEFVDGARGKQSGLRSLQWAWAEVPSVNWHPVRDDVLGITSTLKELATETEKTAQKFQRDKRSLDREGHYYRFNVDCGLEDVRLQESAKKKEIAAATTSYVASQAVFQQMTACANSLAARELDLDYGEYKTPFSLQGVPVSKQFVPRPLDTAEIEQSLLPRPGTRHTGRRIFVLHGLGGIGKTQLAVDFARRHQAVFSSVFWLDGRSEDRLRQSIAGCAGRIPSHQLSTGNKYPVARGGTDLDDAVTYVLEWLARPDNTDWLLCFDNVDLDFERGGVAGAYDIQRYLPGDHGSVLVTTRLLKLAQLGDSKRLTKVDQDQAKAIFTSWYGQQLVITKSSTELLELLDGLPLALAQAASYLRETGLGTSSYLRLYKQQWDHLMSADAEPVLPQTVDGQHNVGTTWTISFKAIEARNQKATNLLRLWAFIGNKDLRHDLLQLGVNGNEDAPATWPAWLNDLACNEVMLLEAVRLLLRYSMIETQESMPGSYAMHPVAHR
ncbi:P-loop containing nucleoside triphosphate hydrolase protein [Lasiosphaeria miniovina]|uniref:P-loop containing nucleoside triphosphate hydrolase protein n=1 Tax=Lasiosphaeria miniovina TaxID=1954250 RepID=A0AA40DQS7_9PEZI|nr:P-loop containing nucleoside triphosphate hydrolase protein [Lasiosphaeria miniovina]KAK0712684.1 P-loop containing nucleoside triphosphate hydrolase protein [Lasiosphaeria miniovina]